MDHSYGTDVLQAGVAGNVRVATESTAENIDFDRTVDVSVQGPRDPHVIAPAGASIEVSGDDIRYVYRTLKSGGLEKANESIESMGFSGGDAVGEEARQIVLSEIQKVFEMSRHALEVDGRAVPSGEEFRATFEETDGLEPVDVELSQQVREVVDKIAAQTTNLMNLRRHVPEAVLRNFAYYAATAPEGANWARQQLDLPPASSPSPAVGAAKTTHQPTTRETGPDELDAVFSTEFASAHAAIPELQSDLRKVRRQLEILSRTID